MCQVGAVTRLAKSGFHALASPEQDSLEVGGLTLDPVFGTFSGGDGSDFHFIGGLYGNDAEAAAGEFYSTYCPPNMVCPAVIIPGYFAAAKE